MRYGWKLAVMGWVVAALGIAAQAQESKLVYPGAEGKLVYKPYTEKGDVILDFSNCGYMGGGVALPEVPVAATLQPETGGGDDLARIQAAVDKVGALPVSVSGFRGAVLLKKGTYRLGGTLRIAAGGVVLRGEGDGENGTVLIATKREKHNLIAVGGSGTRTEVAGTRTTVADAYVPAGARSFAVADASKLKVGDRVMVIRPSTKEWIHAIGMDKIPANWMPIEKMRKGNKTLEEIRKEVVVSEDGKRYDNTRQWQEGSKDLNFDREITAIAGNRITLDAPLSNALQKEFGGGIVYKYEWPGRIEQVGVENLRGVSEFDRSKGERKMTATWTEYFDEAHASHLVTFEACRNGWVSDVTAVHFYGGCVSVGRSAMAVTVQDSQGLDQVSQITGARRYVFNIAGQLSLVQRCYSRRGRHDFVLGAVTAGPNAFVESRSEQSWCTSEPHQRWSAGCLWDNISVEGPDGWLGAMNRGNSGSGHGWSGAQMVFWNCRASVILVQQPPTAQNFAIGYTGTSEDKWPAGQLDGAVRWSRGVARNENAAPYRSGQLTGSGHIEHGEGPVNPRSLYLRQLQDRLGEAAVNATAKGARRPVPDMTPAAHQPARVTQTDGEKKSGGTKAGTGSQEAE